MSSGRLYESWTNALVPGGHRVCHFFCRALALLVCLQVTRAASSHNIQGGKESSTIDFNGVLVWMKDIDSQ